MVGARFRRDDFALLRIERGRPQGNVVNRIAALQHPKELALACRTSPFAWVTFAGVGQRGFDGTAVQSFMRPASRAPNGCVADGLVMAIPNMRVGAYKLPKRFFPRAGLGPFAFLWRDDVPLARRGLAHRAAGHTGRLNDRVAP